MSFFAVLDVHVLLICMYMSCIYISNHIHSYCNAISTAVKNSSGPGAGSVYTRGFLERLQMLHERLQAHDPSARCDSM